MYLFIYLPLIAIYIFKYGGIRGINFIYIGIGHGDASSILDEIICVLHCANMLGNGMNLTILHRAKGKL